jgi:hypothetical protein
VARGSARVKRRNGHTAAKLDNDQVYVAEGLPVVVNKLQSNGAIAAFISPHTAPLNSTSRVHAV